MDQHFALSFRSNVNRKHSAKQTTNFTVDKEKEEIRVRKMNVSIRIEIHIHVTESNQDEWKI